MQSELTAAWSRGPEGYNGVDTGAKVKTILTYLIDSRGLLNIHWTTRGDHLRDSEGIPALGAKVGLPKAVLKCKVGSDESDLMTRPLFAR